MSTSHLHSEAASTNSLTSSKSLNLTLWSIIITLFFQNICLPTAHQSLNWRGSYSLPSFVVTYYLLLTRICQSFFLTHFYPFFRFIWRSAQILSTKKLSDCANPFWFSKPKISISVILILRAEKPPGNFVWVYKIRVVKRFKCSCMNDVVLLWYGAPVDPHCREIISSASLRILP